MRVAICRIKLLLPGTRSLKGKRQALKPLLHGLRRRFNVGVAEVEHHDVWQTAVIGLVSVSNDQRRLHSEMEKAVAWIENERPDLPIEEYAIDVL